MSTAVQHRSAARVEPAVHGAGAATTVHGAARLLRLALRRDRLRTPSWAAVVGVLILASARSVRDLYDSPEELLAYARLVRGNTLMILQAGPGYGLDDPTVGAVLMNETALWTAVLVAVLGILTAVRHTRADEQAGRVELVRSAPVGRHAPLAAAFAGVVIAQGAVAATVAVGLLLMGFAAGGSVAFGAALFGVGVVFGAAALVCAQMAVSSRSAVGLGLGLLGVAFVLRAVGDVGDGRISWLSAVAWSQSVRPFADERWWALLLPAVSTAVFVAAAVRIEARRDLGGGVLRPRAGPASASDRLGSPAGLSWRLLRPTTVGWLGGLAALGAFYGAVAVQAEDMLEEQPELAEWLALTSGASVTDGYLATAVLVVSLFAGAAVVAAVLRLRSEEEAGRGDVVLAAPVSRQRWALGHLVAVAGVALVVQVGSGLATGVAAAVSLQSPGAALRVTAASLAMVPALAVLAGLTFALWALWPRWSPAAWTFVAVAITVGVFGPLLRLPAWAAALSPFHHVPSMPAESMRWGPLVALVGVAVTAVLVGLVALHRRDVGDG